MGEKGGPHVAVMFDSVHTWHETWTFNLSYTYLYTPPL